METGRLNLENRISFQGTNNRWYTCYVGLFSFVHSCSPCFFLFILCIHDLNGETMRWLAKNRNTWREICSKYRRLEKTITQERQVSGRARFRPSCDERGKPEYLEKTLEVAVRSNETQRTIDLMAEARVDPRVVAFVFPSRYSWDQNNNAEN